MASPPRNLTTDERREQLLKELRSHGHLTVPALTEMLNVSGVTIRKDLEQLEVQGLLRRTRGGAVISGRGQLEMHFVGREQIQFDEKRRIARAAANLIHSGQTIFLDSSTTAYQIAKLIGDLTNLTIVTTGLFTAIELSYSDDITVIISGGIWRRRSTSMGSILSNDVLQRLRIDVGFFGASGVTPEDGLTEIDIHEALIKQQIVKLSRVVIGVADSTKFGNVHIGAFALAHEIDHIITDTGAPIEIVNELRALNITVDLV